MKTLTATEASRSFSSLLDAIEHGETVIVTRGGRAVAEIRPARTTTGRHLRLALAALGPPDDALEHDIDAARQLLVSREGELWPDD